MKDNVGYQKLSQSSTVKHGPIGLSIQTYEDCTPMIAQGTRAIVDRFDALKRVGVGAGGAPAGVGSTTLPSSGPKKIKSINPIDCVIHYDDGSWTAYSRERFSETVKKCQ